MPTSQYIFTDARYAKELQRLQAIEQVFDPSSRRRIRSTGIDKNWRCLEVGAGAGSIARWLSETVGERGKVVAVDLDTRFIANISQPNVEVIQTDIKDLPIENPCFDLIHARYVLIHIRDFQVALSRMLKSLKPGGWIVLEEPDFSAARAISGDKQAYQSVNRVNRAIGQMFTAKSMDCALGVKLPAILQSCGLQQLRVENDAHLSNGGSEIAKIMQMSAVQLTEKYIATGEVDRKDIERYCQFTNDQNAWAIYYATVGIVGRKIAT